MEVVGDMDPRALASTLNGYADVWVWPVARLGDFTLQLRLKSADLDVGTALERLHLGGWQVLGRYRRAA